jgi:hypothetical protein
VTDLAALTVDDFAARVGEAFAIDFAEAGRVELTLADATPSPHAGPEGARHPFSVHFHGPPAPIMGQGTYRLRNEAMGDLDIFVVAVAGDGEKTTYEAVFA